MAVNELIPELIIKQIQHTATAQELEILDEWLKADGLNRNEYDAFVKAWEQTSLSAEKNNYNAQAAWMKLDTKIRSGEAVVVPFYQRRVFKMMGVAAAVIVVAVAAFLFTDNGGTDQQVRELALSDNKTITLPDGSTMVLRKGASAEWNKDFSTRNIHLTGEAYFDVMHDAAKPFTIQNLHSSVTVLGTAFDINTTGATDVITVFRGRVMVQNDAHKVILEQDEAVVISDNAATKTIADVNKSAWRSGVMRFSDAPLSTVIADVADYYHTPLLVKPEQLAGKQHVTLQFDHQSLKEVVQEICLTTGLSQRSSGDTIILYRK